MIKKRTKKTTVVGLELDPSHVAAAQVELNGHIAVTKGAVAELRPGVLRDGEVVDVEGLASALRALIVDNDLPTHVRVGIANQRIVVRALDVSPVEDPTALAEAVRLQAPDHLPMAMDEAVIDFQPLGIVETPAGARMRVILVAVRREMVDRLVAATQAAGLTLEGIDLSAFAMVRALHASGTEGAVLYVNLAGLTNVAVADDSGCLFTRAAAGGLASIVSTLSERRGLTAEHARGWMTHVGLVAGPESVEGDRELVAATRQALEDGVHQLADTVRNSLNFYRMQDNAATVERAVLTGPAVAIPGFADRLAELLTMPVDTANVDVRDEAATVGSLSVAAGLAVASA